MSARATIVGGRGDLRLPAAQRVEFVPLSDGALSPERLSEYTYGNFRSYRKDRCAVFASYDGAGLAAYDPSLSAERLDVGENYRWTGSKVGLRRGFRRIIVADYLDWFCWYMRWQRFNAFQILVLVCPLGRMVEDEKRGFIDGLLARLFRRPVVHKIVVVEDEHYRRIVAEWLGETSDVGEPGLIAKKFGEAEFAQSALSTLAGSVLARNRFLDEFGRTLAFRFNRDPTSLLRRIERRYMRRNLRFLSLDEEGEASVQSLEIFADRLEMLPKPPAFLFRLNKRRDRARSDEKWLEALVETHLANVGWFTISSLYEYAESVMARATQRTDRPPAFVDPDLVHDYHVPGKVYLPSAPVLRRVVERMVADGRLNRAVWFREVGRPTLVYHGQRPLPFKTTERCGQCALYVSLRRQCRLWSLLGMTFGPRIQGGEAAADVHSRRSSSTR